MRSARSWSAITTLAARVGEAVRQLRTCPPRVERDDHRAGRGGAPERDAPLGEVAHGDRHPIAWPDTVVLDEATGERRRRRGVGTERDAVERAGHGAWRLAVVDEELGVAVEAAEIEQLAQGRRGVLPCPQGDAVDDDVLHLERCAGGRQGGSDFGQVWEVVSAHPSECSTSDGRNRLRTVRKHCRKRVLPYVPRPDRTPWRSGKGSRWTAEVSPGC